MLNRRKVLVSFGGVIAIAGCSDDTGESEPESEPEPEPEEESEPEPEENTEEEETSTETQGQDDPEPDEEGEAVFEFVSVSPENEQLPADEEITIEAEVENTGTDAGQDTIELEIDNETVKQRQIELESGEITTVEIVFSESAFDPGTLKYTFRTESDSMNSEFDVVQPEEQKQRQAALEEIELAKESLEEGLDIYSDFAGTNDTNILDVTSANDGFQYTAITNQINFDEDVEEYLNNAEEYGIDDLQEKIRIIRREYSLIDAIVRCQDRGQKTREAIGKYADDIDASAHYLLEDKMDSAREERSGFTESIGKVSDMLEGLSSSEVRALTLYEDKIGQFKSENNAFGGYIGVDKNIRRGKETLDDARSAEDYSTTEFRARDAERLFEDALDELPDSDVGFDDVTKSFETGLDSLIEDARETQEQAANQADE